MQPGQLLSGRGECPEVRREWYPRQFTLQVIGITLAIARMVQKAIDVIEDVPLRDLLVAVTLTEVIEGPIGDVLASVCAVLVVEVEGEALARRPPMASFAIRLVIKAEKGTCE